MLIVEPFSDLDGHRLLDCFHDRADDLIDQLRILHQCRALAVPHHLRHRTAHVDVKDRKGALFDSLCHLTHDLRIRAKELEGDRFLIRMDREELFRVPVIIEDRLGAHHLHTEQARPLFSAQQTKWQVCHACHGSQNINIFKFYISYL